MKKYFITGASGFVGTNFLRKIPNSFALGIKEIRNFYEVLAAIKDIDNDSNIVHLAAQSNVDYAIKNPKETHEINVDGTFNLIKALNESGFQGRLLCISSGDIYGPQNINEIPIAESNELRPQNPYAKSKLEAELVAMQLLSDIDFDILFARAFNHIGLGQTDKFVVPAFVKRILASDGQIEVGNLDKERDFSDVSDVIRAYQYILKEGISGEVYNVASGNSIRIRDLLDKIIEKCGKKIKINESLNLKRNNDQDIVKVDNSKLRNLGWSTEKSLDESLDEIINYWRENI